MTNARLWLPWMALIAAGFGFPFRTHAQYQNGSPSPAPGSLANIEGFTVTGTGEAVARPNRLEIDLQISASSELTADAIVKYRDARKRLQETIAALKMENVEVAERALLVDKKGMQQNPYYFDGMPNKRSRSEVELSRKLVLQCANIRELDEEALLQLVARLFDAAQDSGAQIGSSSSYNPYYYNPYMNTNQSGMVRFILDDFEQLEEKAYQQAIASAHARAERLAKLSGVKLGPVSAVRIVSAPGEGAERKNEPGEAKKRIEAGEFREIPIRVELLVRFEVAPERAN